MDEFQTISEVINQTVKDSSYITVLISSGVFILYTLIVKGVDLLKSKDKNKPLLEMAAAIKENTENIVKLNQVLDKTIKDAEIKETSRINNIISTGFNSFKSAILTQCIDTIIHNNIEENKDNISQNLYKTVSTEYYKLYSIFANYEHNSINLVTKLREDWITEIVDECIKLIYNGQESSVRIRQINNKLDISMEEYSVFMTNKILNN